MKSDREFGFTLVETAATIAVIVILMAIIVPAFMAARERGRQTTCLSNMRQLGAAMLMYAQDNNDLFPEGTQPYGRDVPIKPEPLSGKPSGIGWAGQVFPYVKDTTVFACPDDTTETHPVHGMPTYVVSYALNSGFSSNVFPMVSPLKSSAGASNLVLLAEVKGAAAAITLPDEGASRGATAFSPAGDALSLLLANPDPMVPGATSVHYVMGDIDRGGTMPFLDPPRHGAGANYLMTDGHVKWLPPAVVCQPYPYWMKIANCTVEF